jgi:hypothetical protein
MLWAKSRLGEGDTKIKGTKPSMHGTIQRGKAKKNSQLEHHLCIANLQIEILDDEKLQTVHTNEYIYLI